MKCVMDKNMKVKIVKKSFVVILAVLYMFLISACSPTSGVATEEIGDVSPEPTPEEKQVITEEPPKTEESQKTEEPILDLPCTISLWHSFDENEIESLLSVSSAYQEIQPDVEFDFMYSPKFDIKDKFENAASTGGGPSVLIGSGEWGPSFYDHSLIQDISDLAEIELLDEVNSSALSTVQYREALIGLPLNIKGVLMFRNANIMPDAPESFSELIDFAQTATTGDLVGAYLDYGLFYSAGHLEAIGGSLMDVDGNPAFNDDKGIEWVEMLKRFEEMGPIEHNNDNDLNLFREQRVGIIIDHLSNAPELADLIGIDNFRIDLWPVDMSGFVQSDIIYLNANLTEHDLDCGWSFVEYLLSADAQEMFSDPVKAGFIPSVSGVDLKDPLQSQAARAFENGTPLPVNPEMSVYWDPLNFALQSAVEFGVNPADALSAAEASILAQISELRQE